MADAMIALAFFLRFVQPPPSSLELKLMKSCTTTVRFEGVAYGFLLMGGNFFE